MGCMGSPPIDVIQLISVVLSHDFKKCLDQDLDVQPETPVVDVPQIKLHASLDVFDRRGSAPGTVALRPASYARLDVMPEGVVAQDGLEIVVMREGMRTRPDQ